MAPALLIELAPLPVRNYCAAMRRRRIFLTGFAIAVASIAVAAAADWGGGRAGGGGVHAPGRYGGGEHGGGWRRGGRGAPPDGGHGGVIVAPYPDGSYPVPYPVPTDPEPFPATYPGPSGGVAAVTPITPPPAAWFYCSDPAGFYPYVTACHQEWQPMPVAPPPPGSGAPPSVLAWAFCESRAGFYPYVASCDQPWREREPSTPPDVELEAEALWFYCEPAQGYFPYSGSCQENWVEIPAIAPPNAHPEQRPGLAAVTDHSRGR